jgi:hypothetical protein
VFSYSELIDSICCVHVSSDMPIARKASLKRFLEKRKNRLTAGDPYPAAANESSKPAVKDEGAPWLSVNSALSLSWEESDGEHAPRDQKETTATAATTTTTYYCLLFFLKIYLDHETCFTPWHLHRLLVASGELAS